MCDGPEIPEFFYIVSGVLLNKVIKALCQDVSFLYVQYPTSEQCVPSIIMEESAELHQSGMGEWDQV